jgi:hypothetical protein
MRRRYRRQVEIFNFSFLDILACTIGLLIFIMVMVFVLQSGSTALADYSKIIAGDSNRAASLNKQSDADEALAARLEAEVDHVATLVDWNLVNRRNAARAARDFEADRLSADRKTLADLQSKIQQGLRERDDLRTRMNQAATALADAQRRSQNARKREAAFDDRKDAPNILLKPSKAAPNSVCLFVDCRKDRVVLLRFPLKGKPQLLGTTKAEDLDLLTSNFMKEIDAQTRLPNPSVVLWVRPDGIETFNKARSMLPTGLNYGYEPASADWSFGVGE